ncbi:MAG: pyridoxal-phosphate dependent enzyme [Ignavibacteriaceae bacterium]
MSAIESFNVNTAPVIKLNNAFIAAAGLEVYIKREDLINPAISGNKWYKLKYNLIEAEKKGFTRILTFGGAFSNHIYAAASAGKIFGFETIGVIRGEEHLPLNPTLKYANGCGMQLYYMDREEYRRKNESVVINKLRDRFDPFYLIPEGGSNIAGVKGSEEILNNLDITFDYVCVPCGTGGTLAGIISHLKGNKKALGFAVLKDAAFLKPIVNKLVRDYTGKDYSNWDIILDYHFGGYAKFNDELWGFIQDFEKENEIPLEPVYTGKMLFGIYNLISKGYFKKNEKILIIHTGGLQGLEGIKEKMKLNNRLE